MCHSEAGGNTLYDGQRVDSCTNPATGCIFLYAASRGARAKVGGHQATDGGGGQTPAHHDQHVACCFPKDARFSNDESLRTCLFLACVSVCGKMFCSTPHFDCICSRSAVEVEIVSPIVVCS